MKPVSIGGIAICTSRLDARPKRGKALGLVAAAILGIAIIFQPIPAHAAHGGGHGGGFHGGGFHGGGFHHGGFHGGNHGWDGGGYGWSGWGYPYLYGPAFGYWR